MAKELSQSRKELIDMFQEMDKEAEALERKERIDKRVNELKKELEAIAYHAYEQTISKKVAEYQNRLNDTTLSKDELEAIEQERKDFEADPTKYGIHKDRCEITDETEKARALQIVELLKDTDKLGDVNTDPDLLEMIEGYAERNKKD